MASLNLKYLFKSIVFSSLIGILVFFALLLSLVPFADLLYSSVFYIVPLFYCVGTFVSSSILSKKIKRYRFCLGVVSSAIMLIFIFILSCFTVHRFLFSKFLFRLIFIPCFGLLGSLDKRKYFKKLKKNKAI